MNSSIAVVGLTGGIASGKSTVAALVQSYGVPMLSLDQVARDVVRPGCPALDDIRTLWPDAVIGDVLDRGLLGKRMVTDVAVKTALEAIMFPRIRAARDTWIEARRVEGHAAVLIEDPLLFESGSASSYTHTIAVVCNRDTQIARLMARNGFAADYAALRVDVMRSIDPSKVDALIENRGSPEELAAAVQRAWVRLFTP